jgi:arylsulfatase A
LFVDAALDFIRRKKDQPFCFYGAFTIPHAEVIVPEDSFAEYRGRWPEPNAFAGSRTYSPQDQPRAVRAAMISRLDRDVGRIVDLLDELDLTRNTLVMFSSDNGPITAGGQDPEFFDSNGPLRALKFTLYEGGIRVPLIARWPGHIAPSSESHLVSDFADMFPTFAELAGAPLPTTLDGVSIAPTLLGQPERQRQREYHYWEAAPQQAVRFGDWKLYRRDQGAPLELYELAKDIGETRNVAAQNPDITAKLARLLMSARFDSADFPLSQRKSK